jgi:hypothetical protein
VYVTWYLLVCWLLVVVGFGVVTDVLVALSEGLIMMKEGKSEWSVEQEVCGEFPLFKEGVMVATAFTRLSGRSCSAKSCAEKGRAIVHPR